MLKDRKYLLEFFGFFPGGPASVLPWFGTADPSEALRVPENP